MKGPVRRLMYAFFITWPVQSCGQWCCCYIALLSGVKVRVLLGWIDYNSFLLYPQPSKNSADHKWYMFRCRIMPLITHVGGLTGGAIQEQIFILAMYTFGVGWCIILLFDYRVSWCLVYCSRWIWLTLDRPSLLFHGCNQFENTLTVLDCGTRACSVYCCGNFAMGWQ
jgi:hypothetical protein